MSHPRERFDVFGQDTYVHPDEEQHAADMGQPSTAPREHHAVCPTCEGQQAEPGDVAINFGVASTGTPEIGPCPNSFHGVPYETRGAVLCQTPVFCGKCGRQTRPFEDVLVLVDGDWYHDGCAGEES